MTETHDLTLSVETITPVIAQQYLDSGARNRRCSKRTVRKYAAAITAGEWRLNGEAIKLCPDGNLLDGQHRLHAVIAAGMPARMCVIRGVHSDAFKTMDGGKPRNAGDCLYVLDYKHPTALAAATRLLFCYERAWPGRPRSFRATSNEELIQTIVNHPNLVPAAHEYMLRPQFTPLIPHSVGMFCYFLASSTNPSSCRRFFLELSTGRYSKSAKDYPVRVLRERLVQTSMEGIKPTSNTKLAWVVLAWNRYHAGKPLQKLSRIIEKMPRFVPDPIKAFRS